jgi:hypothetical protein
MDEPLKFNGKGQWNYWKKVGELMKLCNLDNLGSGTMKKVEELQQFQKWDNG